MVMVAIGKLHIDVVQASLEGEDMTTQAGDCVAALMRAAMIGHTHAVRALLERGADVNGRDENGRTPLMEAAFGGHVDTLELLLLRNADVNARDKDGWTALMEAASKGHTKAVKALLHGGADPGAISKDGWTALRATAKGHSDIIALLKAEQPRARA